MARAYFKPGLIILAAAFVLSFIVSISVPYLTALDIARARFGSGAQSPGPSGTTGLTESRLGIWGYCNLLGNQQTCARTGYAYKIIYQNTRGGTTVTLNSSWTRGLAVHPVATAVILVAFLASFSTHTTMTLLASLLSFTAALLTLIAFSIDIALFANLKNQVENLNLPSSSTVPGPGFWITLVVLVLVFFAGFFVCCSRRRDRGDSATAYSRSTGKRPFWRRFTRR